MAKKGVTTKVTTEKAPEPAKPGKAETPETALVVVKPGALSTSVGPIVIAALAKTNADEAKANELLNGIASKRFDLLAQTTEAIVKAAKADNSIDLSAAFKSDKKAMEVLNTQLTIALGIREYAPNDKGKSRLVYTKEVRKMFPSPTDTKGAEDTVKKATLRSNFIHMLKKCTQAAEGIIVKKMSFEKDKESGTLMISGPAVQETFGAKSVLLNEKQTVKNPDKEGDSLQLKDKPSFTKLGQIAAATHGKELRKRPQSGTSGSAVDPATAIRSLCASLIQGIERLPADKLDAEVKKSLESVRSALDKALD